MMDAPSSKRHRANHADISVGLQRISRNVLSAILDALKVDPTLAESLPKDFSDLRNDVRDQLLTTIRLETVDGGYVDWKLANPGKLLSYMIRNCPRLAELYKQASVSHPTDKWNLVVSYDEFSPGAQLIGRHLRKVMLLHFTFLELGQGALSSNLVWLCPICASACF